MAASRAEQARRDLAVAELEDKLDELKRKRPRCDECGRLKVVVGKSKLEDKLRELKAELRAARESQREARSA